MQRAQTRSTLRGLAVIPALGFLCLATPAQAQALEDDFWFQVSGFWANVDTDVRVSPVADPDSGTEIDLETDLNLDDNEFLPAFFAGARLGGGFSVGAEYYSLGRDGPVTLSRDIVFEDVTYPATADLTTGFDTDVYRFTVGYAFVRNENMEIGAALGFHGADITLSISGQGSVGGPVQQIETRRTDFLAPLPTIGLFGTFEPMPRLTVGARVDFLSLSIGDYDGRLINAQASVAYRLFRNVGIGVAYRFVDYRVDVEKTNYVGRFAYEYSGPSAFLEIGF